MKSRHGMDLTQGSVLKCLVVFIIPLFLSQMIQQLYSTADRIVVGQFVGDTALAAIGATNSLTALIVHLFLGVAIGCNVVCARYFGAKKREELEKTIHTSLLFAFISGMALAVVGIFFSELFLTWMGTPADVMPDATLYMRIYFAGSPFSLLYNFGASVLRSIGDTKRPLYILSVSGCINVLLNLFCVLVLGWGVAGVAIGTITSQCISSIAVLTILFRTKNEFRLSFSALRLHGDKLKKMLLIGIPAGLSSITISLSNVVLQSTLNTFGKIAVAGSTAAASIEVLISLLVNSTEQSVVSFTGQNMGAKQYGRIRKMVRTAILMSSAIAIFLSLLIVPNGRILLGLFTKDAAVIDSGMIKLTIMCYSHFLYMPVAVSQGTLRGMGISTTPLIVSIFCNCGVRLIWIWIIYPLYPTLPMLFLTIPVSWAIAAAVQFTTYLIFGRRKLARARQKDLEEERKAESTCDSEVKCEVSLH